MPHDLQSILDANEDRAEQAAMELFTTKSAACSKCPHPKHKPGDCKQNVPPEPHMPAWTGKRCRCGEKPKVAAK